MPYVSLYCREELKEVLSEFPLDIETPELSPGTDDQDLRKLSKPGTYTDEWGSVWQIAEPGIIGEVKKPALADWSGLDEFQPPWSIVKERDLDHFNRQCDTSEKFILSSPSARPFERLQFVRGTADVLMELAYGTKEIRTLIEMIHEFHLADVENWTTSNADGVFLLDDWGTQEGLLIKPDMWREMFKPLYRDYCDAIHAAGKYAFFHSDGNIEAIFGDLIEVGVDAINSQLFCMNIEALGARHRGKVTFWGEIDRQHVLPSGSKPEVLTAVRRVRDALDDGMGGVIAQCEWGKDNSKENIEAVFEGWLDARIQS